MIMNVSDWFGLLSTALAIGMIVGAGLKKSTLTRRLALTIVVAIASLIPLPFDICPSLAMVVYAAIGTLSVPLLTILICNLFNVDAPNCRKRCALAAMITGFILYTGEIGVIPFDLSEVGYNPIHSLAFVILAILLADNIGAVVFCLAYALYIAGIYDNFFISIIDPVLWISAIVFLVCQARISVTK